MIHPFYLNRVSLEQACSLIQKGEVVAIPTETVYGLAGNIQNPLAIRKIFEIKKRPFFDPLIIHFGDKNQIYQLCEFQSHLEEKLILQLSDFFHPGPLTFILKKKSSVSPLITAGGSTLALRKPRHPLTLKLLEKTKICLAAPSANLFTKISPTRPEHIRLKVPILDGGPCELGIESTIIQIQVSQKTIFILRQGSYLKKDIENFLLSHKWKNWKVKIKVQKKIPGQFKHHYQPENPLVLVYLKQKERTSKDEVRTKIKEHYPNRVLVEILLGPKASLFSRNVYHQLRQISDKQVAFIVISNHKKMDSWAPVLERLEKASFKTLYF